MDENLEIKPAGETGIEELREQYAALRHLVITILVLVIIVSGAFNLFLVRQVRYSSMDLASLQPQVDQMRAEYDKRAPMMNEFLTKLRDFAKTNPDFAPILIRYTGPIPTNEPAAKAPVSPPVTPPPPGATPKKK